MKGSQIVIIAAVAVGLILISQNANAVDLSALKGYFDDGDIARLQRAANALASQGISGDTLNYCLAQVLQETGIFTTSSANYNATDNLNNFSGISYNGQLASYNSPNDWATDYVRVLGKSPNYPIQATSINDFNSRLKANGYYTDSATTYGNNLNYYYNLLTQ